MVRYACRNRKAGGICLRTQSGAKAHFFWRRIMNEAEKINKISDLVEAIEVAEAVCADKNQDWEKQTTTFIFYDGSIMVFSGPDKWVVV
jgi:hypothetical protein